MEKISSYFKLFDKETNERLIELLKTVPLIPTDIEGVLIVDKSALFDLKANKYITRQFSKIESIGNRLFVVEEAIIEENMHKKEVIMFQINEFSKIISPIYSTLSHDWIAWPQDNDEFDYEDFLSRRKNFLLELFKKEKEIQKSLKIVKQYKTKSEK